MTYPLLCFILQKTSLPFQLPCGLQFSKLLTSLTSSLVFRDLHFINPSLNMDLFKTLLAFLLLIAANGSPVATKRGDLITNLLTIGKDLDKIQLGNCSDIKAALPLGETKPKLPSPSSGLNLKHIVLGRGTQNYTCSSSKKSAKPVATGAVATLFDASCLAGSYPELLHQLPSALKNVSVDTLSFLSVLTGQIASSKSGDLIEGKHYFNREGVPFFDLRFGGSKDWMMAESVGKASAPSKALASRSNVADHDVDWLKLVSKHGSGIKVSIRLHALI